MESEQEINGIARAIIRFSDSQVQIKQGQQNEQQDSESNTSLTDIVSCLESLRDQIWDNNICKSVTQIPKLLHSLTTLSIFKVGNHIDLDVDRQKLKMRSSSRQCLYRIQKFGDAKVQTDLVYSEYGKMTFISFCTAGGIGEEHDKEINNGLFNIYWFLRELHEGRNEQQPSFQPLPLLARITEEQIEEEGANEEIEAQMNNNKGYDVDIKYWAIVFKKVILNHFIRRG
ncbi:MAG: hypothetical protein EZS28_025965 [Streblomastix strix]|uniref:Uncharacterized protein n=1 Tax=Streblomastix strix TaxID=222440 RepID=A0A5J4V771_9EUKA|nr:MAG: hypothetical protein EZS28_025965 [Streblomastix strix]